MTAVLLTGGHGFVGSHLRVRLKERGYTIVSVGREPRTPAAGERYVSLDLMVGEGLAELLEETEPATVFHLAAVPPQAASNSDDVVDGIVVGTRTLCRAIRRVGRPLRLVLAGSSAQYGAIPRTQNPVTEETLGRPIDAYGWAKAAAEAIAMASAVGGQVEVIATRPFNLLGPGQSDSMVAGALARQILLVKGGGANRVTARDLDVVRDFTDVRDAAAAYVDLAERGEPGTVYNICTGRGRSVGEVLKGLLDLAGLDPAVVETIESPGVRVPYQVGSPNRIRAAVGWQASFALRESLAALLESADPGRNPGSAVGP